MKQRGKSVRTLEVREGDVISDVLAPYFGSVTKAAHAMGLSNAQVLHARRRRGYALVTAEEAVKLEADTDGELSRCTLRPDLWPEWYGSPYKAVIRPPLSFEQGRALREWFRCTGGPFPEGVDPNIAEATRRAIRDAGFVPGDVTIEKIQSEYLFASDDIPF